MGAIAIDIETVPTAAAMALPYPEEERTPPGSYKSPDAIANWRINDRAAWEQERIKKYSLSPLYGRVVAVGVAHDPTDDFDDAIETNDLIAISEDDEPELLRRFWARVVHAEPLVTWNGFEFDIPFLMTRSAIHDIEGVPANLLRRYQVSAHFDVKQVVCGWSTRGKGSLDEWAKAFGYGGKIAHGSEVWKMYQEGRYEDIALYAADDAKKTLSLYYRTARVFT
jgi:predicted PolB exonuclease-like 3'-5' exonuclease